MYIFRFEQEYWRLLKGLNRNKDYESHFFPQICICTNIRFLYSCREYFERLLYNLARYCWKMIMEYFKHAKMWKGGGINVSIICIVTLFLAEYCGFGWVVGTFFWVFWFCFGIVWTTKFKHSAGPEWLRSGLRSATRAQPNV